jgi:hypothetical protein
MTSLTLPTADHILHFTEATADALIPQHEYSTELVTSVPTLGQRLVDEMHARSLDSDLSLSVDDPNESDWFDSESKPAAPARRYLMMEASWRSFGRRRWQRAPLLVRQVSRWDWRCFWDPRDRDRIWDSNEEIALHRLLLNRWRVDNMFHASLCLAQTEHLTQFALDARPMLEQMRRRAERQTEALKAGSAAADQLLGLLSC